MACRGLRLAPKQPLPRPLVLHVKHYALFVARLQLAFASHAHDLHTVTMFNVRSIILLVISYVVIPRLTFLPQNVHSLLILFGPFVLPRIVDWFNVARATSRSVPVRPTPPRVKNTLNLLFLAAIVCLTLSLPASRPRTYFLQHKATFALRQAFCSRGFATSGRSLTPTMRYARSSKSMGATSYTI